MAEFGRTPKLNGRAGRDHWGHVFSVALAGGGMQGGQVYGSSDNQGGQPRDGRVTPADLTATILHAWGTRRTRKSATRKAGRWPSVGAKSFAELGKAAGIVAHPAHGQSEEPICA